MGTVHAVRKRLLQAGPLPLPPPGGGRREGMVESGPSAGVQTRNTELLGWSALRQRLWADPAVRSGRRLLHPLDARAIAQRVGDLIGSLPPHWSAAVASVADRFATEWRNLAELVRRNGEDPGRVLPAG